LHVEVFQGEFASVNSYIFSNGQSVVVLDVQRLSAEAQKLADRIRAINLPLTHVLISHGHTDHYTGMPVFRDQFPNAKIVVANEDIKTDIKNYSLFMDQGGATEDEPGLEVPLRPKTSENPDGFDYENTIQVLENNQLLMDGGGTLELTTDYKQNEAPNMTTVYVRELNALFLADLGFNKVHHWQGDNISWHDIANWREELLNIKARYKDLDPVVYPGHGDPCDIGITDTMVAYIDNYKHIITEASSHEEAYNKMVSLYPDYTEADFFLKNSIKNHFENINR